jgi:hypothetical protein
VGLIKHHQIPGNGSNILGPVPGKLIGTENNRIGNKRLSVAGLFQVFPGFGFKDYRGQIKFFRQLILPLFTQGGGQDDEDFPFSFRPLLGNDDTRFYGFSQPHLIGKDGSPVKGLIKGKKGGVYLMGV